MDFQKRPEALYDDWDHIVEIFEVSVREVRNDITKAPQWAVGKTPEEYEEEIALLKEEVDFNFFLSMLAGIEALLVLNVRECVQKRPKEEWAKILRMRFRGEVKSGKKIRIDDVLDCWKRIDSQLFTITTKLKAYFEYQHWLAHGRHWSIHYWNIPTPVDMIIIYNSMLSSMPTMVFEN